MSEDSMKNIFNSYITFLRDINIQFQIVLINKKLNLENIFKYKENENENQIYNDYLNDMKEKLKNDEIFYTNYYIVVSLNKNDNIEDIDRTINILKNCGCNVFRLKGKEKIEKMLYECINKENLYV